QSFKYPQLLICQSCSCLSYVPSCFAFSRFFFLMTRRPRTPTLFPYTTLFRSETTSATRGTRAGCTDCRSLKNCLSIMRWHVWIRSEEHTSELQSRFDLVCRLLLEKKNA